MVVAVAGSRAASVASVVVVAAASAVEAAEAAEAVASVVEEALVADDSHHPASCFHGRPSRKKISREKFFWEGLP